MNHHPIDRREFLMTTTLTTAGILSTSLPLPAAEAGGRRLPIGLQLYAVRGAFERDVPGTIRGAAKMGYQGVEFWGYAGTPAVFKSHSASELKSMLDDAGIKCCGMHLDLKALDPARFETTVEANRTLGNKFLIVAAAKDKMSSKEGISALAALLNASAEKAQASNMRIGYHAHGFDFEKIEGRFAWDYLFSQTNPSVVMQMDIGNSLSGGGDPLGMLKKFPGRTATIHIKEHEDKTFDSRYYREVFALCEGPCKTEWYIVEVGGEGGLDLEVPRKALEALHKAGK